jgi:predicted nucleic acid-binding protein
LWYCDASAILKLAFDEPESDALRLAIQGKDLASSQLSITEVGRALLRHAPNAKSTLQLTIAGFDLVPLSSDILLRAAEIGPTLLRTLDAIHIASAMQLGSGLEGVITYDVRMQQAAREAGVLVLAPGQSV